jgi:transcription termination/antitermination protein NusG
VSDQENPTDNGTPMVDALDTAAEVHDLAEETAEDTLAEAATEAERISDDADDAAEEILEEAVDAAEALAAEGRPDDADVALAEGIVDAAEVEAAGEDAAEEVIAEAVIQTVVMEETADEIGEEIVSEAAEEAPAAPASRPIEVEPVAQAAGDDPFRGPGDWYVVHTYAGYENKVKANLESRIHTMQMEGKIFRVHIPMEDVMEIKSGKKQVVQKKVFPGYLLVKMLYDNDSWYVVRNTPGVTGFVSAGTGSKPTPLSKREVEKILVVKREEVKPQLRLGFEERDVVKIISGPFADFNGTITEINLDQSKLKVLVNIFDRETPVELGFDQVSKV